MCQKGELRARKAWKASADSEDLCGWGRSTSLSTSSDTSCATSRTMSWGQPWGQGAGPGRGCVSPVPPAPPPTHPVVGVRPTGARLLPAVLRGQLPALVDADAPAAARGPALGGLAHLRRQGRSWHQPLCSRLPAPAPADPLHRTESSPPARPQDLARPAAAPGPSAGHFSA